MEAHMTVAATGNPPCYRSQLVSAGGMAFLVITGLDSPGSPPDPYAIHDILHEWRERCERRAEKLPVVALLRDADGHWHAIQHVNGALRPFHPFGAAPAIER
jgi:hypothetical protein